MRYVLFLILFTLLFGFYGGAQSKVSTQIPSAVQPDSKTTSSDPSRDERSLTEKIIDFMKNLLEDEPEPIDESLLRDPL